jgi:hypothetical protein
VSERPSGSGRTIGSAALHVQETALASNCEILEDAGLALTSVFPKAHRDVIDNLTDEEMAVILEVAARLAKADQKEGLTGRPAFTTFYTF